MIGAGLAVLGTKDVIAKILGPTAEYLGGEIKNLVDKCNINLDQVFVKAKDKIGERINEFGQVNPRVLRYIIDEGRFVDEILRQEYMAGVLASSRTSHGHDDRGVYVLNKIHRLSTYQLRMHYLIYNHLKLHFSNSNPRISCPNSCNKMKLFFPWEVYINEMCFFDKENPLSLMTHCVNGLTNERLIGDFFYGTEERVRDRYPSINQRGFVVSPTMAGAEFFLWANGSCGASGEEIFDMKIQTQISEIPISGNTLPVSEP